LIIFISKGADVNAFNNKGFNPVTLAIQHCRPGTQALEKLINSGASLDMFQKGRFIGLTFIRYCSSMEQSRC